MQRKYAYDFSGFISLKVYGEDLTWSPVEAMEYILSIDCFEKRIFREENGDKPLYMGIGCACSDEGYTCLIGLS